MDSRSFTIGLMSGVAIGAHAVWLIGGSNEHEVSLGAEQATDAARVSEVLTVAPTVERDTQEPSIAIIPEGSGPTFGLPFGR